MGILKWKTGLFKRNGDKRALHAKNKQIDSPGKPTYLLNADTPFNITEAFRNLKAALSVSVPKQQGGVVIMATSAFPAEGKTTVSVNLALMFANSNAKVLLLDADIRKGRIARYFKRKSSPGLSDYLSGQNALEEIVHQSDENPNLFYITCGTHSPKPYELLESTETKTLLETLRKEYDYIIVDTPPILLISDALALTSVTDGTVLVCRHQVSFVSDIARAINTLQFAKANILGVVVNDYKETGPRDAYRNKNKYYRYNAYGYTYGSTNPKEKE